MAVRKLASLLTHFQVLQDPRLDRSRLHNLLDILAITICSVICGASSMMMPPFKPFISRVKSPKPWPSRDRARRRSDPDNTNFRMCFQTLVIAFSFEARQRRRRGPGRLGPPDDFSGSHGCIGREARKLSLIR